MKDKIRKLVYIEPLDMDHFEGWLEEMDTPAFPAHLEEKKPTP